MKRIGKIIYRVDTKRMIAEIVIGGLLVAGIAVFVFMNQPSFGRLPRGERLERIKRSPHYRGGEFKNRQPTPLMTSGKPRWRVMGDFLFDKPAGIYPSKPITAVKTDLKKLPADRDAMVWLGHSSYLLQLSGKRMLTDPVFHPASPVAFINKPFKGTAIYAPCDMPDVDYLFITHDHWDHLDYPTVKALKDRIRKVVCPLGVGEHFEYWGFDKARIIELDWQEEAVLDEGVKVYCLPARHFSGRGLTSNQTLWASFLLQTPSRTVYMGGDSGYGTHFAEIGCRFPDIDLAILENGQYNEAWRHIHTLPVFLGRIAEELKARQVVTVHHSKYALAKHPWDEPLRNEKEMAAETGQSLVVPVIGQVVTLGEEEGEGREKG